MIKACDGLFFGLRHHGGKSLRFPHGQISQHLAIEVDVRLLQGRDQAAVGRAVQPGRRVDADDPLFAQVAPSCTPVARGIPHALKHRLVGALEEQVLGASLPLGIL